MDAKRLIDLRKAAERAVAEMPDGELKVKAFEVILAHLLGGAAADVRCGLARPVSRWLPSAAVRLERYAHPPADAAVAWLCRH